jgi:hypothetical protein
MPVIVPVSKLVQILLQMLRGNVVERPGNGTLQLRPKRFHTIRMNVAINKLLRMMFHRAVPKAGLGDLVVAAQFVSINGRALGNIGDDVRQQGLRLHVRNGSSLNASTAFQDSGNGSLARGSASPFAATSAPDVGFIGFNGSLEEAAILIHKLPNLVVYPPCGLVGHAGLAHQFHRGYSVAARRHQEHGMEPCPQWRRGFMKDGPGSRGNLKTAPSTGKALPASDRMKTIGLAALGAFAAVRIALLKEILKAGSVVRELPMKVFDCVFHGSVLPKPLLDVKG